MSRLIDDNQQTRQKSFETKKAIGLCFEHLGAQAAFQASLSGHNRLQHIVMSSTYRVNKQRVSQIRKIPQKNESCAGCIQRLRNLT